MASVVGRVLSLVYAAAIIAFAYHNSGDEAAFKYGMFFIFPLALIWFPDAMADFTGSIGGTYVTESSPPGCIYAGGWVILLLPVITWVIVWART